MAYTVTIGKEYKFEAAHKLPFHEGKCKNLHGHSYILELEVSGKIQTGETSQSGMIVDYERLDYYIKPYLNLLDHTFLNDLASSMTHSEYFVCPTAEHLAVWFFTMLTEAFSKDIRTPSERRTFENLRLERVTVKETATSFATARRSE